MERETKPPQERVEPSETNSGRRSGEKRRKWAGNETAIETETDR
jgi:hypothetical protein